MWIHGEKSFREVKKMAEKELKDLIMGTYWIGIADGQPIYKDKNNDIWLGGSNVIIPMFRSRKKARAFLEKAKHKLPGIRWTKTVECEVQD